MKDIASGNPGEIDESLYSRQIYVMGVEAQKKLQGANVIISGIGGVGVEIAKNVILSGVKSVTVHDTKNCTMDDLSSQFYLNESMIGKNRAECSVKMLSELNPYVVTKAVSGELIEEVLQKYSVIVLTEASYKEQMRLSEMARKLKKAFITCDTRGLFGQVFCDFGDDFVVFDEDGLSPKVAPITGISKEKEGEVTCSDQWHNLVDGDYVTFSNIKGMTQLNNCKPMPIKRLGNFSFSICDTSSFTDYEEGGFVTQVKMPKKVAFKTYKSSEDAPEFQFILSEFSKINNASQIQLAFTTLHRFVEKQKRLPRAYHNEDAAEFFSMCVKRAGELKIELDIELVTTFSKICAGQLAPMNSIFGGIAAQEVLKACTGKFMPIQQYFCYDACECLPEIALEVNAVKTGSRYDAQVNVFGDMFQNVLKDSKYFVVGAGAIGCEILKNLAMMGVGNIVVTDMDLIEKSNLNRQFLFRASDIHCSKSKTAANAIKAMNQLTNICYHVNKVGVETEDTYSEFFYDSLNGVLTALDNVDARLYIDRKCVIYRKPLIDSGTMGTLGNVQSIVPMLTECYSSSMDPPEKSIPLCTVKHFPTAIEHTLQWSLNLFEDVFNHAIVNTISFLNDPSFVESLAEKCDNTSYETLLAIKKNMLARPSCYEDCVTWARFQFEDLFSNQIKQLLFNFPPDFKSANGQLFWSGQKKKPTPIQFDSTVTLHIDFILAAANLKGDIYGIAPVLDRKKIKDVLQKVQVPEFTPRAGVKIAVTDEELQDQNKDQAVDGCLIQNIIQEMQAMDQNHGAKKTIEFQKDDDTNFHMDFITAASNLRATIYNIPHADKRKSKLIAGKIIPAIATSCSILAGLACLEVYKVAQNFNTIDRYQNTFFNLANSTFGFSEPKKVVLNKFYDNTWTFWDRFEINTPMTLKQFIEHFKKEHNLEITMLSQNTTMLYTFFMSTTKYEQRKDLLINKVIEKIMGEPIEDHVKSLVLEAYCNDENGDEIEVPYIRYLLKP